MSSKKKRTLPEEEDDEESGASEQEEPTFLYQLNQPDDGVGCPLCKTKSSLFPDLSRLVMMPEELTGLFDLHIDVLTRHWEDHARFSNDWTKLNLMLLIAEAKRRRDNGTRLAVRFVFQSNAERVGNPYPLELCGEAWKEGYTVNVSASHEGVKVADIQAQVGLRSFRAAIREKIARREKLARLNAQLPLLEEVRRIKQFLAREADSEEHAVKLMSGGPDSAKEIPYTYKLCDLLDREGIECLIDKTSTQGWIARVKGT